MSVIVAGIIFSAACVICTAGTIANEELDIRIGCFCIAVLSGIMAYSLFTV